MRKFEKTSLTFSQQIEHLKQRGLIFSDETKAIKYFSNISYYRLSAYWYTFLEIPQKTHCFKADSNFDTVIKTYVFDKKLRFLIFYEIERIEIALRTQIIYQYCQAFGNNWHEEITFYKHPAYFNKFNDLMQDEMRKTSEVFIKHYFNEYNDPINPPAWMVLELPSFGQLSMLFKNLRLNVAKKNIANHFCIHENVLESWLECLTYVRNNCAHHMRLWNRKLPKSPIIPTHTKNEWLKTIPAADRQNRIYLVLAVIRYLQRAVTPTGNFNNKLKQLIEQFPNIPLDYMGFPANWKEDNLWK